MNTELVSYFRGGNRVKKSFLKFLLSKFYYETLEPFEKFAVIELIFHLLEKPNLDCIGFNKNVDKVQLYRALEFILTDQNMELKKNRKKFVLYCNQFMWPNESEYYGQKFGTMKGFDLSMFFIQKVMTKSKYPPEKFIGVGYKDKGNKRIVAKKGYFSWQNYAGFIFDESENKFSEHNILSEPELMKELLEDDIEDSLMEY
jgi:hypothetical protein